MSQFLNNMSWVVCLIVIMCLIGLAAFCVWLLCRAIKREMDRATGKDWIDDLFEDVYLRQQDKIDKVYEDMKKEGYKIPEGLK